MRKIIFVIGNATEIFNASYLLNERSLNWHKTIIFSIGNYRVSEAFNFTLIVEVLILEEEEENFKI
jgi:hypothetical protein